MDYSSFLSEYPVIRRHYEHSEKVLEALRSDLAAALSDSEFKDKLTILATGSYGRSEASDQSDLDLFLFFDSDRPLDVLSDEKLAIDKVIATYIEKNVGDTGTFGTDAIVNFSEMLINIGGENDSNKTLTRRMLFLLEGTWLYGKERFDRYRNDLIKVYLNPDNPDNQIARFLLNDIIRYYRTITTDFEYKIRETKKSWGLRNAKLRFSRKILYFGGITCVAETALRSNAEKASEVPSLLDIPVLQRIWQVGANNKFTPQIFSMYEYFLQSIGDNEKRRELDAVRRNARDQSPIFVEMRSKGKDFSQALTNWLQAQYPNSAGGEPHPIHDSLLF